MDGVGRLKKWLRVRCQPIHMGPVQATDGETRLVAEGSTSILSSLVLVWSEGVSGPLVKAQMAVAVAAEALVVARVDEAWSEQGSSFGGLKPELKL